MRRLLAMAGILALVGGCDVIGSVGDAVFPGAGGAVAPTPYRASLDRGEDPRDLTVAVEVTPDVQLVDFRESARFPVTRYCIETFGSSDAAWEMDPATEDWAVIRSGGRALLRARCTGRI